MMSAYMAETNTTGVCDNYCVSGSSCGLERLVHTFTMQMLFSYAVYTDFMLFVLCTCRNDCIPPLPPLYIQSPSFVCARLSALQ